MAGRSATGPARVYMRGRQQLGTVTAWPKTTVDMSVNSVSDEAAFLVCIAGNVQQPVVEDGLLRHVSQLPAACWQTTGLTSP